jgi:hypothetical protein
MFSQPVTATLSPHAWQLKFEEAHDCVRRLAFHIHGQEAGWGEERSEEGGFRA